MGRPRRLHAALGAAFFILQTITPAHAVRVAARLAAPGRTGMPAVAAPPAPASLGLSPVLTAPAALSAPSAPAQTLSAAAGIHSAAAATAARAASVAQAVPFTAAPLALPAALPRAAERGRPAPAAAPSARTALDVLNARGAGKLGIGAVYDGGLRAADDLVEAAPTAAYKPARRDLVGERAAYELQTRVDRAYAELAAIHSLRMKKKPVAAARVHGLLAELDALYAATPGPDLAGLSWPQIQRALADYHGTRAADRARMREVRDAGRPFDAAAYNLAAIALNQAVLKTQLRAARMLLSKNSPLTQEALRRNSGLWTLAGAFNSALQLKAETRFREVIARTRRTVREYWTRDADGSPIRVFSLDGFDIELIGDKDASGRGRVTIRQQRWRNAAATLGAAARDLRQGRDAQALKSLAELQRLYTIDYGRLPLTPPLAARFAEIAAAVGALHARAAALAALPSRQEAVKALTADIKRLSDGLLVPKLSAWRDVGYEDLTAALRSQAHTLSSQQDEIARLLRNAVDLEAAADLLAASLPGAERKVVLRLPKKEQAAMLEMIDGLAAWAGRGQVRKKQDAALYLEHAARHLRDGEPRFAGDFLRRAAARLSERAGDIERMMPNVRRRAAGLYAEFRDRDILRRVEDVHAGLGRRRILAAQRERLIGELTQLHETYFERRLPEPGLRRAEAFIGRAIAMIRERRYRPAQQALRRAQQHVRDKFLP